MPDQHDYSPKPARQAPPPFVGPPRSGALAPKPRADRPTLPPFSPPFVKRPSPVVREVTEESPPAGGTVSPPSGPAWLEDAPGESVASGAPVTEVGVTWVNPDEPAVTAPPQPATGIEWLDSPVPDGAASGASTASAEDVDDVFGWDPAEERVGALDSAPTSESLEALKELEPWALPGVAPSASNSEEVAGALERVAARIRSGDLFVPGASAAVTDAAVLAAVLAALLQRERG